VWPLYGGADEISFKVSPSRGRKNIEDTLADHLQGTLVTDSYAASARYAAARPGVTHAQCWAHGGRGFESALDSDPQAHEEDPSQ
jgi:transposase